MPRRRLAVSALAGLAVGLTVALLLLPAGGGNAADISTTAATTATTAPVWVSPRETRIASTVVIGSRLQMEGDRVLFTYNLYGMAPFSGLAPRDAHLPVVAAPASLTLAYAGGTSSTRGLGPTQRAGRFEVPPGITLDQVEGISIGSYWVPVPAGYTIDLSPSTGDWVPAAPGVQARIVQVVEQAENRLVIVELGGDAALTGGLAIAGEGREWQSSSYSQIGGGRWTLDFRGQTLPDPVQLVVRGVGWIEVAGGGPVDLEGIPR